MIEIILLILLCNSNAKKVKARGRKPGMFVFLTIVLWVGMEFLGAIIGSVIAVFRSQDSLFLAYLMGLVFAVIGAVISVQIAKNVTPGNDYPPPQPQPFNRPIQRPYNANQLPPNQGNTQNDVAWQPPQKDASVQLEKKSDPTDGAQE